MIKGQKKKNKKGGKIIAIEGRKKNNRKYRTKK